MPDEDIWHSFFDAGLSNIRVELRAVVENGTGLPAECTDHALLYNLLHFETASSLQEM